MVKTFFSGYLEVDDISVDLIERCLYTSVYSITGNVLPISDKQSCPDLLIRTSGELRLSDFLLWQSSYSVTHFTSVLWPDFGLHHLMAAIFHYQSKKYYIGEILSSLSSGPPNDSTSTFKDNFDEEQEKRKRIYRFLEVLENSKFCSSQNDSELKFSQNDSRIIGSMTNLHGNKRL